MEAEIATRVRENRQRKHMSRRMKAGNLPSLRRQTEAAPKKKARFITQIVHISKKPRRAYIAGV